MLRQPNLVIIGIRDRSSGVHEACTIAGPSLSGMVGGGAMSDPRRDPSGRRVAIISALVAAMVVTLFGRLYYVQMLDPNKPVQSAGILRDATIVIPAPRGQR